MLEELQVTNLGLIPEATISPAVGLTVITGETGAGKTVMLGALRLLSGESASKGLIGPHGDVADVSALFVGPSEHVARRVVSEGRSKAYLDGSITTASALGETIGSKVSIVGQHDQHTITSSSGVRRLVDASLTSDEIDALDAYSAAWQAFTLVNAEAELLGSDPRHIARELETVRFQVGEIADAGFALGDDVELRNRASKLRNAQELASSIDVVLTQLGDEGAAASLTEAGRAIEGAARLDPELEQLASEVTDSITRLSDVVAEVVRYASDLDVDPSHLNETEQRVALLASLKRKYGESLESVLTFGKEAAEREAELEALLSSADDIAERLAEATSILEETGATLRVSRTTAGIRIAVAACAHLTDLGFSAPSVEISIAPSQPTASGADTATILFASDEVLTPGPISAIASGGELSRLVLALTLASGGVDTDIVAFDEIDAGVGGETALSMGRKLSALSETRQVICVTHLPQVAAFASKHFVVRRDGATTMIEEVTEDDRTEELARMLAGLSSSEKGRRHAEELLTIAHGRE